MHFDLLSTWETPQKWAWLVGVGVVGVVCPGFRFLKVGNYAYYNNAAIEATALFVQQQVKGAIIADLYHVTPPHGGKWLLYWIIARELRQ